MSKNVELARKDAYFIIQWKEEMRKIIKMKHPDIDKNKLEKFLDKKIAEKLRNRECDLVNNYNGKSICTNLLSIVDLIFNNNLIIGGAGCLFLQHGVKKNPIITYIIDIMQKRKYHKNERKKYKKGSYEWAYHNLMQLMYKIKINSLYGAMGYKGFPLFNIFLAEAVTSFGQNIITSASMGFENFLSDNCPLLSPNELYLYMLNIKKEAKQYEDIIFDIIPEKSVEEVVERLLRKCNFDYNDDFIRGIADMISNCNDKQRKLLYYKNNIDEFMEISYIRDKFKYIMDTAGVLLIPELNDIKDEKCRYMVKDLWKFIEIFVYYNYPTGDRIRKGKYLYRKSVLYIDTDSNMLSVHKFVNYFKDKCIDWNTESRSEQEVRFTAVNLIALYMSNCVENTLGNMTMNMNISEEWGKRLVMKNEFYFEMMLFTDKKKRYLAQMILQEGVLLNDGFGYPEIKGFDFIKANTKESVRDTYIDICLNDILKAEPKINVAKIYSKVIKFKRSIEQSLYRGETIYYKQANVGIMAKYVDPYRIPGIKGTLLWNLLCPENMIELPVDVDLVPIKSITEDKKVREEFARLFPNEYEMIVDEFGLPQDHPDYKKKGFKFNINVVAKPKNVTELPEWYKWLMDTDKITSDAIGLIIPILKSLGLHSLETSNGKEIAANVISI